MMSTILRTGLQFLTLVIFISVSSADVNAQSEGDDSTNAIVWWVVGTGGVFDSNNDGGDTLSATLGQTAIDSAATEDSSYGKSVQLSERNESSQRGTVYLGFWLPRNHLEYSYPDREPFLRPGALELTNYPNPFDGETTIQYELPGAGRVRMRVFDALGTPVRVLVDQVEDAGLHNVVWNSRDDFAGKVAAGPYYCQVDWTPVFTQPERTTKDRRLITVVR